MSAPCKACFHDSCSAERVRRYEAAEARHAFTIARDYLKGAFSKMLLPHLTAEQRNELVAVYAADLRVAAVVLDGPHREALNDAANKLSEAMPTLEKLSVTGGPARKEVAAAIKCVRVAADRLDKVDSAIELAVSR